MTMAFTSNNSHQSLGRLCTGGIELNIEEVAELLRRLEDAQHVLTTAPRVMINEPKIGPSADRRHNKHTVADVSFAPPPPPPPRSQNGEEKISSKTEFVGIRDSANRDPLLPFPDGIDSLLTSYGCDQLPLAEQFLKTQRSVTIGFRQHENFARSKEIPNDDCQGQVEWKHMWTSDAEDHNGNPVNSIVYSSHFNGLHSGGGAGWVISSSRCLLNLWECNANPSPSLQLMHSQVTDFNVTDMAIDPSVELLVSASDHHESGMNCLSLHTLSTDFGFLAYKAQLPTYSKPCRSEIRERVISLNSFGGPLSSCCATTVEDLIFIYDLPSMYHSALPSKCKAVLQGHGAPVTALHQSNFNISLYSGSSNGSIFLWDLKTKPVAPAQRLVSPSGVVDLFAFSDVQIVSAGQDGVLRMWDLRYQTSLPLTSLAVNGPSISAMAISPVGLVCALGSLQGLYTTSIRNGTFTRLAHIPISAAAGVGVSGLVWNTEIMELYASTTSGQISAYSCYETLC